jgi:hypothetical protein
MTNALAPPPAPRTRKLPAKGLKRIALIVAGWFLIIIAAPVGALPGPGGVPVFLAGLVLLLRNSQWAKKTYVKLTLRYPTLLMWSRKMLKQGFRMPTWAEVKTWPGQTARQVWAFIRRRLKAA